MKNVKYTVSSGNAFVTLCGPKELLDRIISSNDLVYRVPNIAVKEGQSIGNLIRFSSEKNLIKITHKDDCLTVDYGDVRIADLGDKYIVRDLIWLILPILEHSRALHSQYMVHATAIEKSGKGAVFFGGTHAGKTSVAASLAFKYGCKIVATEHTLLGFDGIEGGTLWMEGYNGLKSYIPEIPVLHNDRDPWGKDNRFSIDLRKIGVSAPSSAANVLSYVNVVHGSTNLEVREWSARKSLVHLGEWMKWMINSAQSFIHDGVSQLPPFDNIKFGVNRMRLIKKWIEEEKRIVFMKGSADLIAKETLQRLS